MDTFGRALGSIGERKRSVSDEEIKVGSVVRLKSGGPKMTVKNDFYGEWNCVWFIDDKIQSNTFTPESLEVVKDK